MSVRELTTMEQWRAEQEVHKYFAGLEDELHSLGRYPVTAVRDKCEPKVETPWMQLASGLPFDIVLGPDGYPTDIKGGTIHDIAHALSMQCRYGGHTTKHYSVAEHSVLVALRVWQLARTHGASLEQTVRAARAGLLHDASEAFLVDIPRPWKYTPAFEGYRRCERVVQTILEKRFDCSMAEDPLEILIDTADYEMLAVERRDVMSPSGRQWNEMPSPPKGYIAGTCECPSDAKARFLRLARNLGVNK